MSSSARLPVLSCAEAAAAEAAFLGGDAALSWKLMNLAARGVADEALSLLGRKPGRILVLAGKGNNGADAFLAALHCARPGTEIVAVFAEGGPARAQAQRAWAARKKGVRIGVVAAANLRQLADFEFDLIFDGILGQGFRAPLSAELRAFLRATDALRGLRIAVDLPSGLGDDATGPAFRADLTVSIGCLKRPLLAPKSARFVGRLRVLDIGLPLGETEEACVTATSLAPLRRPRRARSDKRHQGRLLIVGGSDRMPGAVLMNTAAALRSGAALVTTCLPESVRAKAAVAYPEAMWRGLSTGRDGRVEGSNLKEIRSLLTDKDALLIGSGMGEKAAKVIGTVVARCAADLVLDADALRPAVIVASKRTPVRVLLPHAGEFKRLSGRDASVAAARAYARKTKTIVVLKGPVTCVTDGVRSLHIPFGGPVLARGGSGDLLAGIVASVLSRRHELGLTPLDAVVLATTWHARAADWLRETHGEEAVRTTDLLAGLSPVLRG
jgi:ADP-dependent NAD(P)H-hydrate dehydratase / NAD(P)H-hydrate epimerase